ncbi:hypothetical protein EYF80_060367 [Liparis tanakae]|uniref:Uncharacterized protein n=1 Tax=Liparis tanakae TaxID=230148 RepID=A0A4Z2EM18_9TELE|nr:hypothetical protein EYF80_060367 [Liparis tanakae]
MAPNVRVVRRRSLPSGGKAAAPLSSERKRRAAPLSAGFAGASAGRLGAAGLKVAGEGSAHDLLAAPGPPPPSEYAAAAE